jgi:hypothetical protein
LFTCSFFWAAGNQLSQAMGHNQRMLEENTDWESKVEIIGH